MARFCLIVNPAAGRGRALQSVRPATAALDAAAAGYRVTESASLDHAGQLAAEAAGAGEVVVAVGGDGMAGALAAACARHGGSFGIIPAGRGNDLARVLGIPADPAAAAGTLTAGAIRTIDLIGVSVPGAPEIVVAGSVYLGVPSVAGEIANRVALADRAAGLSGRRAAGGSRVAACRVHRGWQPVQARLQRVCHRRGELGLLRRRACWSRLRPASTMACLTW